MNELTSINLRLNKQLKAEAEQLFSKLGLNMTTALNIFLRQAVREQAIPFSITAKEPTADIFPVYTGSYRPEQNYDHFIAEKLMESECKIAEGSMKYHTQDEVFSAIEEIIHDARKSLDL